MGRFFGRNKREEDNEEEFIFEPPTGDVEYDEDSGLYVDEVDNAYTEEELMQFGYSFVDEENDEDIIEEEFEEDGTTEEEFSQINSRREEEIEEDSDYPEEYVDFEEEESDNKRFSNIVKASLSMLVIIIVSVIIWFFFFKSSEPTDVSKNSEYKLQSVEEVLNLMYDNETVEELINKNDTILEYFDKSLHPNLDIRDGDIYMARYSEFSNSSTDIDYIFLVEDGSNGMIVEYKISNELDLPSVRLATFKFDEKGIVTKFTEDRVYPVIDR